uniref:Putative mucin 68d n=1 Tax=Panstrongylus lignarius TaxID=156445 RepID=A0A224XH61_9HEMI
MWKVLLVTWFVGICSVVSCPHHCQCYLDEGLKTANCSGSALSSPPQPSQIDVLNVRPHYLGFRTRLSPKGFKTFHNIKYLNLSNTTVTTIPDDVFNGLNYIITIDLSYNKIKRLNGGVFKELITLQTLLLRGNPLLLTKSDDIIVSKSLRKLDMGYCGLRNIPVGTFAQVVSLTALFLDGNYIQIVDHHSLPSRLTYLNLAKNYIVNVPIVVLRSMKSLTRIDLSENSINCTCQLLLLQDTFSGQGRSFENDITCSAPKQFFGQKLSHINENHLCNLEFTKKQRLTNSIKYSGDIPSNRKHNMIKPLHDDDYGIQGDQPYINNEFLNTPSNDGGVIDFTGTMGAHVANTLTKRNLNAFDTFSDENNKLSDSKNLLTSDPTSTDTEISNEQVDEEIPENLKMAEKEVDEIHSSVSNTTDEHDSIEESNEHESNPTVQHESAHTEKIDEETEFQASPIESETMKSSQEETDFTLSTNHTVEELNSHHETSKEMHTEETTAVHNVEMTSESEDTSASLLDDVEVLTNHAQNSTNETKSHYTDHEHQTDTSRSLDDLEDFTINTQNSTNEYTEHDHHISGSEETTSSLMDDVEELTSDKHNFTHEIMSRNLLEENITHEFEDTSVSSLDEIFNTEPFTTTRPETQTLNIWPSPRTDMTDYNYDAQHDDYSSVEPVNGSTSDVTTSISYQPLTTEVYTSEDKLTTEMNTTSSSFPIELEEGSGDFSNETSIEDTQTVKWFDEEENESTTEDYTVENVSELFNITSEETGFAHYTAENTSSSSSESIEDITTISSEIAVSNETETEVSYELSTTEESTTEEITTEDTTTDDSSPQISSEEMTSPADNETQTFTTEEELEETTHLSTEETTEETLTTTEETTSGEEVDVSSTSSDISSSSSSAPVEVTSESFTESSATSEESTTDVTETSTDSTPWAVIPGHDDDDDEGSSTSSSTKSEPSTSESSSTEASSAAEVDVIVVQSSTDSTSVSSTPVSEVEFVSKSVYIDDNENMNLYRTQQDLAEATAPDIVTIGIIAVIILLVIIIIIISLAVVCRRTKRPKNKIRLPADPEANAGTEMQDMLLPKPPENGVKVVPKNYTNGTTAANGNKPEQQKEEETPVLQSTEPEQLQENDWEDKPEPIETVTARLTMLARPQTPVFIPKTVN